MPRYEVTIGGQRYEVSSDRELSDDEAYRAAENNVEPAQPDPNGESSVVRFAKGFLPFGGNPVEAAKSIYGAARHPIDTIGSFLKGAYDTSVNEGSKAVHAAGNAIKDRDPLMAASAVEHAIGAIPIVGSSVPGIDESMMAGDTAGAFGKATAGALEALAPKIGPGTLKIAGRAGDAYGHIPFAPGRKIVGTGGRALEALGEAIDQRVVGRRPTQVEGVEAYGPPSRSRASREVPGYRMDDSPYDGWHSQAPEPAPPLPQSAAVMAEEGRYLPSKSGYQPGENLPDSAGVAELHRQIQGSAEMAQEGRYLPSQSGYRAGEEIPTAPGELTPEMRAAFAAPEPSWRAPVGPETAPGGRPAFGDVQTQQPLPGLGEPPQSPLSAAFADFDRQAEALSPAGINRTWADIKRDVPLMDGQRELTDAAPLPSWAADPVRAARAGRMKRAPAAAPAAPPSIQALQQAATAPSSRDLMASFDQGVAGAGSVASSFQPDVVSALQNMGIPLRLATGIAARASAGAKTLEEALTAALRTANMGRVAQ